MKREYLTFHSHLNYNSKCDILEVLVDADSMITYGIYVDGLKKGEEFMEYYRGPNYVGTSTNVRNYSKQYSLVQIPKRWKVAWESLRMVYLGEYLLISNLV